MLFWRHTSFDVQKFELVCLYICRQLSVLQVNSVRIFPMKLKICMVYHINNIFRIRYFAFQYFTYLSLCLYWVKVIFFSIQVIFFSIRYKTIRGETQ